MTPLLPYFSGKTGVGFLPILAFLAAVFVAATVRFRFAADRDRAARFLFRFSLIYLPVVLLALTFDAIS